MTAKNLILYLFQTIIGFAGHLLGLIIYPLAFIFRHKILAWANSLLYEDEINHIYKIKWGVKWYHFIHPCFVGFWFFTGLDSEHWGHNKYKEKLKIKWFGEFYMYFDDSDCVDISLKGKLRYFWLCYCWEAFRNGFYNWNMLWREGKANEETIKVTFKK